MGRRLLFMGCRFIWVIDGTGIEQLLGLRGYCDRLSVGVGKGVDSSVF